MTYNSSVVNYTKKQNKILGIPLYALVVIFPVFIGIQFIESLIVLVGVELGEYVEYGILVLYVIILLIVRSVDDKYFDLLYMQNFILKNKRTKEIKIEPLCYI